jgi:hypothetical protein
MGREGGWETVLSTQRETDVVMTANHCIKAGKCQGKARKCQGKSGECPQVERECSQVQRGCPQVDGHGLSHKPQAPNDKTAQKDNKDRLENHSIDRIQPLDIH